MDKSNFKIICGKSGDNGFQFYLTTKNPGVIWKKRPTLEYAFNQAIEWFNNEMIFITMTSN